MEPLEKVQHDWALYRSLKPTIDRTYPSGRFVALDEGGIIADAENMDAPDSILDALGKNSPDILVVQAGVEYPEYVTIFVENGGPCPV